MDIASAFAAPRMVQLGGLPYFIGPLCVADYAVLAAWLDDVIPGRDDRSTPPPIGDGRSQAALDSQHGWTMLVWVALRHQGVAYPEAADIALQADVDDATREAERYVFRRAVYSRRRTMKATGRGDDIGESWWGPIVASLNEHRHMSLDDIGRLTLDQIALIAEEGCPGEKPGKMSFEQVQAMWEANQPKPEPHVEAAANG